MLCKQTERKSNYLTMTIEEIKANWTTTDSVIYKTPEIKLKSLEAAKKRVIAKE